MFFATSVSRVSTRAGGHPTPSSPFLLFPPSPPPPQKKTIGARHASAFRIAALCTVLHVRRVVLIAWPYQLLKWRPARRRHRRDGLTAGR